MAIGDMMVDSIPVPPDEIWRGSSAEDIDAFNFSGPRNEIFATPESNAFTAEQMLAGGDAATELLRRRGTAKYQQLVKDGAKPEEALLLVAPDLFAGNPTALSRAINVATKKPTANSEYEPSFTQTPFGTVFRAGPGSARLLENKESPELLARRRLLESEIKGLQNPRDMLAAVEAKSPEAKARLEALKQEYWGTFPRQSTPMAPASIASEPDAGTFYAGAAEGEPTPSRSRGRMFMGSPEDEPALPAAPELSARPPQQVAQSPGAPYKDGQYLRSKRDGKLYQVVNGQPVAVR
jgi:hypothetical protein